jgi:hypothetical protein
MKRLWVGLLIIVLLMGSGSGFAYSGPIEPDEKPMENELDERVSIFLEGDEYFPGDVKYLSNGNVAVQGFIGSMMEIGEVDRDGNLVDEHVIHFEAPDWTHQDSLLISNFIVEDIDGNLYAAASGGVAEIAYDFSTSAVTKFPEFWNEVLWCNVQSKGRAMSNTLSGFEGFELTSGGSVLGFTYEEGQSHIDIEMIDYIGGVDGPSQAKL